MAKVYNSIEELIGNTPLLRLNNIENKYGLCAKLYAKLEYFNPAGSVKDRVGKAMLEDALERGILNKDTVIIEPTSGNTGIGLASVAAVKGYKVIIVMPETMSKERRKLISAYGAELVLTDGAEGMAGAIEKANELSKEMPNSIIAGQFVNPSNWKAHYKTTAPEIYDALNGKVDFFVSGVGTGGTITGVGKFLKEKNRDIKIVGVEPSSSSVLSGGLSGKHNIQGIGAGFIPEILDKSVIDEIICVSDEEAILFARKMGKQEGFLVGISSGAALWAATELAKKEENRDKNIVVILADSGDRYLSTELYD